MSIVFGSPSEKDQGVFGHSRAVGECFKWSHGFLFALTLTHTK